MRKILYVYGGPEFHPTRAAGELLSNLIGSREGYCLETTSDLDMLARLPEGKYAAVVVYTTGFADELTPERERGLLDFIESGGGFVGVHSAADSFRGSRRYIDMLGCEFLTHPDHHSFKVEIVNTDTDHPITTRMESFTITDEMYHLQSYDPSKVTVLAETNWQGRKLPLAYTKSYGQGRVAYLANGHDLRAWIHPEFQKMLRRAIRWSAGEEKRSGKIRCGLLGFGPTCNMGAGHASWIGQTEGMEVVAVCDASPDRIAAAKEQLPGLKGYFTNLDDMLAMDEVDLVVNILPHYLHAPMAMKCLEAGKHVVMEKPFCLTVAEGKDLIQKAREQGVMLSVFHCRRWDDDYMTIRELLNKRLIGDVFHIDYSSVGYHQPGFEWRSDKAVSGGIMYDWGAHIIDWILNLIPSEMTQLMGDFQKRVWHAVTNEDHGKINVKFKNGVTVDIMMSSIAAVNRPKWQILGTQGSIEMNSQDEIYLTSMVKGVRQHSKIERMFGADWKKYYWNVADHLLMGEELIVKPEQALRVISILEAASQSSELGRSVTPEVL
ncbi:ThuA domain-containing protein [Paenibacillus mendelii]|uniref:ThuA domain-containing protein n=1 Tax=Paenibacillus mendelii TaxID=206163 RepID=A0ABV6J2T7_9BACL|nr:ThuA domain-containing protein [Paenibacillus mendelii]MCQ6563934.1 ThuA domain-containing protein [Paenibacillus mendelii]